MKTNENPSRDCTEHEIAIEMRLHGALDPEAARQLDEHLETCDACRQLEQLTTRMEGAMQHRAEAVYEQQDWNEVRATVARMAARPRQLMLRVAAAAVVGAPLAFWLAGPAGIGGLLGGVLAGAAAIALDRRRARKLAQVAPAEQMLTSLRDELDTRVRGNEQAVVWCAALAVGWALYVCNALVSGDYGGQTWLALAFVVCFGGMGVNVHKRLLPRQRRERAELR